MKLPLVHGGKPVVSVSTSVDAETLQIVLVGPVEFGIQEERDRTSPRARMPLVLREVMRQ